MNIIGREHWGARPATAYTGQHPNDVRTLVVHHTVGKAPVLKSGVKRELKNIQRYHMDANGWSDIGYNILIDRWGRVWEGRGLRRVGAHTKGYNTNTLGVAFMGNYSNIELTARQIRAFNELLVKLKAHGVRLEYTKGHRQMPAQATACPGVNVMKQLGL